MKTALTPSEQYQTALRNAHRSYYSPMAVTDSSLVGSFLTAYNECIDSTKGKGSDDSGKDYPYTIGGVNYIMRIVHRCQNSSAVTYRTALKTEKVAYEVARNDVVHDPLVVNDSGILGDSTVQSTYNDCLSSAKGGGVELMTRTYSNGTTTHVVVGCKDGSGSYHVNFKNAIAQYNTNTEADPDPIMLDETSMDDYDISTAANDCNPSGDETDLDPPTNGATGGRLNWREIFN